MAEIDLFSLKQEDPFEIKVEDGRVLLRVAPTPANAKKPRVDYIQNSLHELDVEYVPEKLLEVYERASNEFEVIWDVVDEEDRFSVEISEEEQSATLMILPSHPNAAPLTLDLLQKALEKAGVQHGIMLNILENIVRKDLINERVIVARSKPAMHGADGYLQLVYGRGEMMQTAPLRLDFHEMQILKTVEAGDILINIVPPTDGEDGYTVGETVFKAKPGKKCRIYPGRNTKYNAERTQLIATKAGCLVLAGYTVSVENVMRVKNVDASTRHLRFDGIIYVEGNVEDDFRVESNVRIEVLGSVGKATLITNGDVKVGRGISGATIRAGHSVQSAFIADANIQAGENVIVTEYIVTSQVTAGKVIHVTQKDGFVTGGKIHAGNFVHIPSIGARKMAETIIEVGIDVTMRKHFSELEERLNVNFESFERFRKNLLILQSATEKRGILPPDHQARFEQIIKNTEGLRHTLLTDIASWRDMLGTIKEDRESNGGLIFIEGDVLPGTIIQIKRLQMPIKNPYKHVAFYAREKIHARNYDEAIKRYKHYFKNIAAERT